MNPTVLAKQLTRSVEEYLRLSFATTTPLFDGMLESFLTTAGNLYKGPYLSIRLPFQQGEEKADFFPDVPLPYTPYKHQEIAFRRLGVASRPTLVATGTGSGKTECFLIPVLDHCYQQRNRPGIKAIFIYPMNALATDQATRLARSIHDNPQLKGRITAGLYVGDKEAKSSTFMDARRIITDKEMLRRSPPDILLTNYKMLDFLLIRAKDSDLWKGNEAETLKFLVVDELHTFDGAQGTDLACLIRRLKARLGTPRKYLVCVGTSATLGGPAATEDLVRYATDVFDEPFDDDSVITEYRLALGDYLATSPVEYIGFPGVDKSDRLDPEGYRDETEYAFAQARLWFEDLTFCEHESLWRVDLATKLRKHYLFQNLLRLLGGGISDWRDLQLSFDKSLRLDDVSPAYIENLLTSLVTLVATARDDSSSPKQWLEVEAAGKPIQLRPFLELRIQLWLRELRRMVSMLPVGDKPPALLFADDGSVPEGRIALPPVHCRDCGAMGWLSHRATDQRQLTTDLDVIYNAFFSQSPKSTLLFPMQGVDVPWDFPEGLDRQLCVCCGELNSRSTRRCENCGNEALVWVHEADNSKVSKDRKSGGAMRKSHKDCPFCQSKNSLLILGARATNMSATLAGQLQTSRFNSDKQLIAFSDSVQDSAHRAGYIAARVRSFGFRSVLKQLLDNRRGAPTLAEVIERFNRYWIEQLGPEHFIGTFIPTDMEWLRDYGALRREGRLPEGSNLADLVGRRMSWGVTAEFGLHSRIGRSLERTGAASGLLDEEKLAAAIAQLMTMLAEEIGSFHALSQSRLTHFFIGILAHLRIVGGICHPALNAYIHEEGKTYLISGVGERRFYMPVMHNQPPRFLASKRAGGFEMIGSGRGHQASWYQAWLHKSLFAGQDFQLAGDIAAAVYDMVLAVAEETGLLGSIETKSNIKVWGLSPEGLRISPQTTELQCDHCRSSHTVAEAEQAHWEGMPCLRRSCIGRYEIVGSGLDFYGRLYRYGEVGRIVAAEHTGLLTRDERDAVEQSFKKDPHERRPWDINLLSATPTLEMGVDIGELSSVLLCSTPPGQANYLQRIGRAGRRDGNALNVTLANGVAHDLYFYSDPDEMMSGEVETPGVFLDASAVLERQYTAWCLDHWVKEKGEHAVIPLKLSTVLSAVGDTKKDQRKFPYTFLNFVETRRTELIESFLSLFASDYGTVLSGFSIDWIRQFAAGDEGRQGSLSYRIEEKLQQQRRESDSLRKEARRLNDLIHRLKANNPLAPEDTEKLEDLEMEMRALQSLAARIGAKDTLQFLTDEGLIPNYAFPEQGVLLRSVIYRSRQDNAVSAGKPGATGESERWVYEYERPAEAALSELAPLNHFYAGGRRVTISRIDMRVSPQEIWRLCRSCQHSERVDAGDHFKVCPRCGDSWWRDISQKKTMLRLKQVYASTADRRSRIADDRDDRDSQFYTRQLLVDFDPADITAAWRIDKEGWPFGFEFLSRAEFREFNSGHQDDSAEEITIAGQEAKREGFKVCRYCGTVQGGGTGQQGESQEHTLSCTSRGKENPDNLLDGVYLYREFHSEAIRILLPVTTGLEADVTENSFVAALHLGLKKKFGGSIDHLRVAQSVEPDPDSGMSKRYLVIYDAVPGGTGYLKQLMSDQHALLEVLVEHALPVLERCSCNQIEGMDGCYRCLYAYRNSRDMATVSRQKARDVIHTIRENIDAIEPVESLSRISLSPLVESELEGRFIEALRRSGQQETGFELRPEFQGTDAGWYLRYGEQRWFIVPQVSLGEADGVAEPSRADFIIRPLSDRRGNTASLPIVVFTDGFQFHRDRLEKDTAQRMAIKVSGNYLIWSFSYHDIQSALEGKDAGQWDLLLGMGPDKTNQLLTQYNCDALQSMHRASSFTWLITYLRNPVLGLWRTWSSTVALTWYLKAGNVPVGSGTFAEMLPLLAHSRLSELNSVSAIRVRDSMNLIQTGVLADEAGIRNGDVHRIGAVLIFDDSDGMEDSSLESWQAFLRLMNICQFQPRSSFFSKKGIENSLYSSITAPELKQENELLTGWAALEQDTLPEEMEFINSIKSAGVPVPELGFELEDDEGEIVAEAFLAWMDDKVAVIQEEFSEDERFFVERQWTVFSPNQVDELINTKKYFNRRDAE